MRVTADTNVLVRAITGDDPTRSPLAQRLLKEAEAVYLPAPVLCELVWVLRSTYGHRSSDVMDTLRILLESDSTITDGPAVMAGLLAMSGGADFADGVIAHLGAVAGADVFATFDKNASTALASTGVNTLLIG